MGSRSCQCPEEGEIPMNRLLGISSGRKGILKAQRQGFQRASTEPCASNSNTVEACPPLHAAASIEALCLPTWTMEITPYSDLPSSFPLWASKPWLQWKPEAIFLNCTLVLSLSLLPPCSEKTIQPRGPGAQAIAPRPLLLSGAAAQAL